MLCNPNDMHTMSTSTLTVQNQYSCLMIQNNMQSWRSNCQQGYTQEWVHCKNKRIQLGSGYTQHELQLQNVPIGRSITVLEQYWSPVSVNN